MDFHILGPVGVVANGKEIRLDGPKQRTVLAALLLARGRVVSDAQLSTLLWRWEPPATMSAQIYTYVSRLRTRLAPEVRIIRRVPGYEMQIESARFDYAEFERLAQRGREELKAEHYHEAAAQLSRALALWRGPALSNVTSFLADNELPRLEEARMAALDARIEADIMLGRSAEVVAELTRLVAEHPLRERLRAYLMTALHYSGRQADALTVYHEGRRVLADEVGVDPGAALKTAYQQILIGGPGRQPMDPGGADDAAARRQRFHRPGRSAPRPDALSAPACGADHPAGYRRGGGRPHRAQASGEPAV
jgi:DNA-binding SARP family transcriptional activator